MYLTFRISLPKQQVRGASEATSEGRLVWWDKARHLVPTRPPTLCCISAQQEASESGITKSVGVLFGISWLWPKNSTSAFLFMRPGVILSIEFFTVPLTYFCHRTFVSQIETGSKISTLLHYYRPAETLEGQLYHGKTFPQRTQTHTQTPKISILLKQYYRVMNSYSNKCEIQTCTAKYALSRGGVFWEKQH